MKLSGSKEFSGFFKNFATLGYSSNYMFEIISRELVKKLEYMSPSDIKNTIWAYAITKQADFPIVGCITSRIPLIQGEFNSEALESLKQSYDLMNIEFPIGKQ